MKPVVKKGGIVPIENLYEDLKQIVRDVIKILDSVLEKNRNSISTTERSQVIEYINGRHAQAFPMVERLRRANAPDDTEYQRLLEESKKRIDNLRGLRVVGGKRPRSGARKTRRRKGQPNGQSLKTDS